MESSPIDIQIESNMDIHVENISDTLVLPYRNTIYDSHDMKYANTLRGLFYKLSPECQTSFNRFTINLMAENAIRRNKLLDAIDDFKGLNFKICNAEGYQWNTFADNAWNYRPYQP